MKKFLNYLKSGFLYLWQLPQHLLGLSILLIIKGEAKHSFKDIIYYYYDPFPGGISLGNYMIIGEHWSKSIKHEFGHSIQSKILGWFYLPTVGICSGLHAATYEWRLKKGWVSSYYDYWTEKWADKLGNVKR